MFIKLKDKYNDTWIINKERINYCIIRDKTITIQTDETTIELEATANATPQDTEDFIEQLIK